MSGIISKVIKTENIRWRELKFIQQEGFKELSEESRQKLKCSIILNEFTQPFYVWQDPEATIWCLDGKNRTDMLNQIAAGQLEDILHLLPDGFNPPDVPDELPATFIQCSSKEDAARLVLIYSSIYARITQQGLFDFIQEYNLEFEKMNNVIDLPDFSMPRFEQKFDVYDIQGSEEPEVGVPETEVIVSAGDIFQVNDHIIVCGSFKDQDLIAKLMNGEKARIVNCDPPYNLPADFIVCDNKNERRHEDFAEAAGEMSDEEFTQFLAKVMQVSVDNTVPGAIHYIFMDFRHTWHMTEAGRRVYGRVQPKQVCVWVKDHMANGSFYRPQQELCFLFSNEQAKHLWNNDLVDMGGFYKNENELCFIFKSGGDNDKHLSKLAMEKRIRTNVWKYPSAISAANPDRFELKNHPTPKPVAMIADAILDTTNAGDIVIDWFLGSGTCLIACEQTGRRGRFSEIDPKYIQGDIIRFNNYCEKRGIPVSFKHLNGTLTLEQILSTESVA